MPKPTHDLFLSYSQTLQPRVLELRDALEKRGLRVWLDAFELQAGAELPRLQQAVQSAKALVQVLNAAALESEWVEKERDWGLEAKAADDSYAIIPILEGVGKKNAERFYHNRNFISLEWDRSIVDLADAIFHALAKTAAPVRPPAASRIEVNALRIEFMNPEWIQGTTGESIGDANGPQRVKAQARLVHVPTQGPGSDSGWFAFVSPLCSTELTELRWYLEQFLEWPYGVFAARARAVEDLLPVWGRALYSATLERAPLVLASWLRDSVGERQAVLEPQRAHTPPLPDQARASTALLALPWELLANEAGYLLDARPPTRILRRLGRESTPTELEPQSVLRVLLVLARPDIAGQDLVDPRVSTQAVTEALAPLGDLADLKVLVDGTFMALEQALEQAEQAGRPFQIVHFDGHGAYNPHTGLGELCFEDEVDVAAGSLRRRERRVDALTLGTLLQAHRIPLMVLEACQTSQSEPAVEQSVAAEIMRAGVGSVVAMRHAVRAETAIRFTRSFYEGLAEGLRIGAAMNRATRALKLDSSRAPVGSLRRITLQDWMVPVLFQERDGDLALLSTGAHRSQEVLNALRRAREGELPPHPPHGFVGRAQGVLELHRLLKPNVAVVLLAEGGIGKTELSVVLARWMADLQTVERVAWVSVERISEARAMLQVLGAQLEKGYSVALSEGTGPQEQRWHRALQPVLKVLQRRSTLLVVDNLESLLPPSNESPSESLLEVLELLETLRRTGQTRLLVTSREIPPGDFRVYPLPRLLRSEGLQLVRQVLERSGGAPRTEEGQASTETLVERVGRHARALVLLAPLVGEQGAVLTTERLTMELERLERLYPGDRQNSLIASVRLSLDRLPERARKQVRALGVFHAVVHVVVLAKVLQIENEESLELCQLLVRLGLAGENGPYLLLDPALAATVRPELGQEERAVFAERWFEGMVKLIDFLYEQSFQDAVFAHDCARTGAVELLAVLDEGVRRFEVGTSTAEVIVQSTVRLEQLFARLSLPGMLTCIVALRQQIRGRLADVWSHELFCLEKAELDRLVNRGQAAEALVKVNALLEQAEAADLADTIDVYDVAVACGTKGQILQELDQAEASLVPLMEALNRFQALLNLGYKLAPQMINSTVQRIANAYLALGRLDEAVELYEGVISRDEERGDDRGAALARLNLASVWLKIGCADEALPAFHTARMKLETLGEFREVAGVWHQIGLLLHECAEWEQSEYAYKQAVILWTKLRNEPKLADTLNQLATLFLEQGLHDQALDVFRDALEHCGHIEQPTKVARIQHGMAASLCALGRLDEARVAISRALGVIGTLGRDAEPWKSWCILQTVEHESGDHSAATVARQKSMDAYRSARVDGWESLDEIASMIDDLAHQTSEEGPIPAQATVPPPEDWPPSLHPIRRYIVSILTGTLDPSWRDDFTIDPMSAIELDLLAEAVKNWKEQ